MGDAPLGIVGRIAQRGAERAEIVRQRRTQLTQLFEKDRAEFGTAPDSGWDAVRAPDEEHTGRAAPDGR